MSEKIRLMWMAGYIIALILIGILWVWACDRLRKSINPNRKRWLVKTRNENILWVIISISSLILVFLASYPGFIFLSMNKLRCIAICFVGIVFAFLEYYLKGAGTGKECGFFGTIVLAFSEFFGHVLLICGILLFVLSFNASLNDLAWNSKVPIDHDDNVVTIYPEFMGEYKIGHNVDNNSYMYFYEDQDGTLVIEDDFEIDSENIKDSSETYIEKHTVTTFYKDSERPIGSEKYETSEEEVYYLLFLNQKQQVDIKYQTH